ncbi:hypothetical protein EB796_012320 [Bugula neritina]|uniref:Uncharacterized protein n=1 Tax=Bugula neritina TaxID=10212 RepID=A0A7J7JTP2_BUGNE|nr:hypothetical protein EB796_012320 [Bugula neritina]
MLVQGPLRDTQVENCVNRNIYRHEYPQDMKATGTLVQEWNSRCYTENSSVPEFPTAIWLVCVSPINYPRLIYTQNRHYTISHNSIHIHIISYNSSIYSLNN